MSRRLIVCALALVCLLCGCTDSQYPEGMRLEFDDIAITLPGDFQDMSGENIAEDADFLFGRKTLVVMGLAEEKASLKSMTLGEYTEYVLQGNGLACEIDSIGDGYLFTYEKPVGDTIYTYTIATYEGTTNFWILQFYCPKENLQENQPEIDISLEGIQPRMG